MIIYIKSLNFFSIYVGSINADVDSGSNIKFRLSVVAKKLVVNKLDKLILLEMASPYISFTKESKRFKFALTI